MPIAPRVLNPDIGLLILRLWIGVIGTYHGAQILFGLFDGPGLSNFAAHLEALHVPAPTLSALLAGLAEFLGGILIAVGFAARAAAVPLAFAMFVAFFTEHQRIFDAQKGGGEYALTVAAIALALLFTGPGRFTLLATLPRRPHSRPPYPAAHT